MQNITTVLRLIKSTMLKMLTFTVASVFFAVSFVSNHYAAYLTFIFSKKSIDIQKKSSIIKVY